MIRDFEDAAATTMFTFLIGQRGVCGVANHDIRIMSGMETRRTVWCILMTGCYALFRVVICLCDVHPEIQ